MMTIEIAMTAAIGIVIGGFFAFTMGRDRPSWQKLGFVAVFVLLTFAMQWVNSFQEEAYAKSRAKYVSQYEMTAFACGVLSAQNRKALTDGCEKFKDLQP